MNTESKIVLVEPRAPGYHVYSRVALPRLGLPLLAAVIKKAGYKNVSQYCEDLAPLDLEDICRADFVGISTTTSTAHAAYRIGAHVKSVNPACIVVIGGVHATFMPEEPFDPEYCRLWNIPFPVCDHVIRGEAEFTILALLRAYEEGENVSEQILGERLRNGFNERIDYTRTIQNIDEIPFPDLKSIVGAKRMRIAPMITSRGCPFDCAFCSVIEMFSQRMRYRSIDPDNPCSVISELKQLLNQSIRSVFFYDDNFNANHNRTRELLENMIRAGVVPKAWTAQVRATEIVRDKELLKLMQRTNCIMLYLGLESVNPETLLEYNKKQTVEQIVEAIRVLKEYNIRAHGMFVVGADGDTAESIRATAKFVIKNNISTVQFMILTPLPGTRYFEMLTEQDRIFDYNWSRYDAHHTVFWPRNMSPQELQYETFEAMRKVYSWSRVAAPVLQQNFLTSFFRYYGHTLVQKHISKSADYTSHLPRSIRPITDQRSLRPSIHPGLTTT